MCRCIFDDILLLLLLLLLNSTFTSLLITKMGKPRRFRGHRGATAALNFEHVGVCRCIFDNIFLLLLLLLLK